MFGGIGYASVGSLGDLNDLWEYRNGEWTWVGGSSQTEQQGSYGTEGMPASGNVPGARYTAVGWTDKNGNFWLFGGLGLDSSGTRGNLNDLWEYNPTVGMWTWVSGARTLCSIHGDYGCAGVYGTKGVAAASSSPGGRVGAVAWTGPDGDLWLFGGEGVDANGAFGTLNDLWKFDPKTLMWTWVGGSDMVGQFGIYGAEGSASATNIPGSRSDAAGWTDGQGNFWLFGGIGLDKDGNACQNVPYCLLSDLWKYSPATGMWTWMAGPDVANRAGNYGTQGYASVTESPGARDTPVSWTDGGGNLWLFGGIGLDASNAYGDLSDLWEYNPATGKWMWVSGPNQAGQPGTYGMKGVGASANMPAARDWAAGWLDPMGNLWLFGGGIDAKTGIVAQKFNDLWEYQP